MRHPCKILFRILFLAWLYAAPASAFNLLELYEQTLTTHPVLKSKEYTIEQAKAQKDQTLSKLLPQLAASGNLSWNEFSQEQQVSAFSREEKQVTTRYEGLRGVIQARQALFDLPSFLNLQGAGEAVLQTEREWEAAHMAVSADLIDRYFAALEAADEIGYLQGEMELTESEMQRLRRMFERQLAPVTDVYEVEAYHQSLLTHEIELQNAKAVALEKLRETTGVPVPEVAALVRENLPEVPGQPEQWAGDAVRNHPSLAALQHAVGAAEKIIAGARAGHLPQLSLQMSETYADNGGFDNRQFPRYTVGSVGLQVNVPLYSGGAVEAGVRDAVARYHIAQEKYTEKLREIERETRTAWLNARAGRARIDSTRRETEARDKARAAQEKSYEYGIATIGAVLEAKKNHLKAQFEQAQARYDYIRALVALRLWAGTLSRVDVEDINTWLAGAAVQPKTGK